MHLQAAAPATEEDVERSLKEDEQALLDVWGHDAQHPDSAAAGDGDADVPAGKATARGKKKAGPAASKAGSKPAAAKRGTAVARAAVPPAQPSRPRTRRAAAAPARGYGEADTDSSADEACGSDEDGRTPAKSASQVSGSVDGGAEVRARATKHNARSKHVPAEQRDSLQHELEPTCSNASTASKRKRAERGRACAAAASRADTVSSLTAGAYDSDSSVSSDASCARSRKLQRSGTRSGTRATLAAAPEAKAKGCLQKGRGEKGGAGAAERQGSLRDVSNVSELAQGMRKMTVATNSGTRTRAAAARNERA